MLRGNKARYQQAVLGHAVVGAGVAVESAQVGQRPSMDFRKSTGLGYRYTFSTFASGRIMADGLQKDIGSTASGIS